MISEKLQVRFWDGTIKNAENRNEAVTIAKEGLKPWMQEGDHLVWIKLPDEFKLPSLAIIVDEWNEHTDACTVIEKVVNE